jgi:uncharacterized membrane protein
MKHRRFAAWLFSFVPLLISLIVLPMLPDTIPTHYGADGYATNYGSKYVMLVLPLFAILAGLLFLVCAKYALKDKEKGAQNVRVLFWVDIFSSLVFTAITIWILHASYTQAENIYRADSDGLKVFSIVWSIGWILLGNVLPKCKQNILLGIRTYWTLKSENVWYRTHRFGGKVFIASGIISCIVCLFFLNGLAALYFSMGFTIGTAVILTSVYSYRVYKQEKQSSTAE